MVEVFKKGEAKVEDFGEIIHDDKTTFRLHCSYKVFKKAEYEYRNKV